MHQYFQHYCSVKEFSEIFSNFAVGLGALGAASTGIKIVYDWLIDKSNQKKLIRFREIYPPQELGKGYRIADSVALPGKIYIIDLRTRQKRWIQSSSTFIDLGFNWGAIEHMSVNEFDSYVEIKPILTSGKPWS